MKLAIIPDTVRYFDSLPDTALVDINAGEILTGRSRASIYRHFQSGDLTLIKIGNSSRLRVGELRRLMGGART